MRVLIETIPYDEHAAAIKWLLERRGHVVDFLFKSDFPARQSVSIRAGKDGCSLIIPELAAGPLNAYDAGLVRRHRGPTTSPQVDPADRVFAGRQARIVEEALNEFVDVQGWWVNPPAGVKSYNSKPLQLKMAQRAGLTIPETLISNDPVEIRRFVGDAPGDVICKPLQPAVWTRGGASKLTFTSKIDLDDIRCHEDSLRYAPSIFQHYVRKTAEVRAVFMGRTCFAYEVSSARREEVTDWRACYADGTGLRLKVTTLPKALHEAILSFMDSIGLVFGCFDFCIDERGRYVFLEVNPMGQFLWLEKEPSSPPLLSAFCDFLESGNPAYEAGPPRDAFRYSDAMKTDAFAQIEKSYEAHDSSNNDCFTYADEDFQVEPA